LLSDSDSSPFSIFNLRFLSCLILLFTEVEDDGNREAISTPFSSASRLSSLGLVTSPSVDDPLTLLDDSVEDLLDGIADLPGDSVDLFGNEVLDVEGIGSKSMVGDKGEEGSGTENNGIGEEDLITRPGIPNSSPDSEELEEFCLILEEPPESSWEELPEADEDELGLGHAEGNGEELG